MFQRYSF